MLPSAMMMKAFQSTVRQKLQSSSDTTEEH